MDFDHRPGSKKVNAIACMAGRVSWDQTLAEIEKCDLVCSNCHRIRTKQRRQ